MRLKLKYLYDTAVNYPKLQKENQETLRTWMSMAGNFLLAICKFIMGCATASGFLCVSALYSCLIGVAKRQYISCKRQEENPTLIQQSFFRIGMAVLLAGMVYGVYMGRLIIYPPKAYFHISVGIFIAFFCFIDIGIAAYSLINIPTSKIGTLLLLGKRLASLAFALPAIVMVQIDINSFVNGKDLSYYDGIFGVVVGFIIVVIGLGMMCYAKYSFIEAHL